MSPTRKPTTSGTRAKTGTAKPKSAARTGAAAAGDRSRPPTPRPTTVPARRSAPVVAARRADNRPLWVILASLAVLDLVFAVLAILR